ncbi:MAG: hypothetical protein QG673_921 [Pseudomonadota bacterium]|nr:hypothetical protein [Pseudomonadota bacterium]
MKNLLAILFAGVFASAAIAAEASSPMMMENSPVAAKAAASSGKHNKKHSKKHHKSHKAASAA